MLKNNTCIDCTMVIVSPIHNVQQYMTSLDKRAVVYSAQFTVNISICSCSSSSDLFCSGSEISDKNGLMLRGSYNVTHII